MHTLSSSNQSRIAPTQMAPTDDENRALQMAIGESLSDYNSDIAIQTWESSRIKAEDEAHVSGPRICIDDRIHDMALRSAFELPL